MKTKNVKIRKAVEKKKIQCVLCQANFEVWLDNLKLNPEREDGLHQKLLSFCPVCGKVA